MPALSHHCLSAPTTKPGATWLGTWALITSALAVAFAVGLVTALDPSVLRPSSRVQELVRPRR